MAAAIRLEDLLKAQAKLKQDEAKKQATETMSVEEFRKMATEMTEVNPGTTTKSIIKKGLTDKNGEGLNANVIKLTKVIKDATLKKGNVAGANVTAADVTPAGRVEKSTQEIDVARRARLEQQAGKYQKGGIGFLKEQMNIPVNLKGMEALKASFAGIKKMFSLENVFDLDEGKPQGLMGQVVRRKVAQNQYVDKRMESEEKRMLNLPQYQGVEGRAKARKDLRAQFNRQQDTMAGIVENQKERARIEKVIAEGYDTPAMRAKAAGTVEQEARLDVRMAKDDAVYRARKKADEAVPVATESKPKLTRVETDTSNSMKKATAAAEKAAVDENEAEAARAAGEQTTTLKKIEENTSVLKDMSSKLAVPVAAGAAAAEEGGGLGLGDMAGTGLKRLGGTVKRVGGNWLGKVGGVGKLAKGLGIGAVGALAGEGIQAGGEALKEAGWEQTGKAVGVAGTATKYAGYGAMLGSVIPGVGTAVGAGVGGLIGAGKGIWDQYFSGDKAKPVEKASVTFHQAKIVNDYQQEVAAGNLTKEQALAAVKQLSKDPATIAQAEKVFGGPSAATAAQVTPSTSSQVADTVYNKSGENVAAARKGPELGAAPVVINAPTNVSNTSNYGPKSPPRNTESSIQQYNRSKFAMST